MPTARQQLSMTEKVGYSLGDCAANFVFQTQLIFLMFFYTDVFGIPAASVALLLLLSRFWDAVNDPIMGAIADRTRTRWGRFRPWVLWTAVPFGVMFVLTYTTPNLPMVGKIAWAYVTYILLMMVYTANNIPYSALTGVLTGDSLERTTLASWRFIFAMTAAVLVQGFANDIVDYLGADNESIVHATIDDAMLTIDERSPGTAKVKVVATDPSGHESAKSFIFKTMKASSEAPFVRDALPTLELEQGFGTHRIDVAAAFEPGEYGPLSFSARSRKPAIAQATIVDGELELTEVGTGVTTINVIARDRYRSTAQLEFTVAIEAPGNVAPRVVERPKLRLDEEFEQFDLDLRELFIDDDGNPLTFSATLSDRLVVTRFIEQGRLSLGEVGPGLSRLTVEAHDGRGGVATLDIPVVVASGENLPPAATNFPGSLTRSEGYGAVTIDLADAFDDPDGDSLAFRVTVIDQARGFQRTVSLFALLAVVFFAITFASTKERIQPDPMQRTSFAQDIVDLFRCGPWIALFLLTVFLFINLAMRGGITLYYFTYFVGREDLFGWFNAVGLVVAMIGIMFSKPLALRFGKRNTFRVCLFLTAVLAFLFVVVPPNAIWLIFALQMLMQLCYGPTIPMLWAMMADVADYSEWKTGRRATAMAFAATVFGLKVGLSLGGAISSWLLDVYGYVPNVQQSETAMRGILLLMSVFPAMAFFIGVGILFFYPIDREMERTIEADLVARRTHFSAQ